MPLPRESDWLRATSQGGRSGRTVADGPGARRSSPRRRREPELARAVQEIGRNVTGVRGDVSNLGDLDRLFAQIKREKGKLDIVFANAGAAEYAPFGEITEEHYDSIFNINVKGLLFTV